MRGNDETLNSETTNDNKPRITAAENYEKRFRFENKIKYRKSSTLRRKLKKRYHKSKVFVLLFFVSLVIVFFLFTAVKMAIDQNRENLEMQKQMRIKKQMEDEARRKSF